MHHFSRFMGLRVWRTGRHSLTNKSVSHSENWIYGSLSCCSTADELKWRFQYLRLYFHCVKYRRRFTSCFVDCKTDCVKRVICMQTDGQVSCLIAFVTARRCLLPDARSLKLVGFHRRSSRLAVRRIQDANLHAADARRGHDQALVCTDVTGYVHVWRTNQWLHSLLTRVDKVQGPQGPITPSNGQYFVRLLTAQNYHKLVKVCDQLLVIATFCQ